MNIGPLLLMLVITTTILIKTFNKDKKTSLNLINQENIYHNQILLSKIK